MNSSPKTSRKLLSALSDLERQVDQLTGGAEAPTDPLVWAEDRLGFPLDDWQQDVLLGDHHRLLMVCPRQAGKSTVVAALAGWTMLSRPGVRLAILSPTIRQSGMLAAKTADVLRDEPITTETSTKLVLANGSSLDSLPGDRPATIRGITADLLIIDEASRVKTELVVAGLPTVAATDGGIIMLTTPAGASGAFFEFWSDAEDQTWERTFVTIEQVNHYTEKAIKTMRRRLGERMFSQEFEGRFLEPPGALFSADAIDALFGERAIEWEGPLGAKPDAFKPLF